MRSAVAGRLRWSCLAPLLVQTCSWRTVPVTRCFLSKSVPGGAVASLDARVLSQGTCSRRRSLVTFVTVPGPGEHASIDENFVRSSGPGGQNVNKLSTKVELRVALAEADWLPDAVRARLETQQANRINKAGELVIQSQEHRTQGRNRDAAFSKLQQVVALASIEPKVRKVRKGLTKKAKERRLQNKKKRSEVKEGRRKNFDW